MSGLPRLFHESWLDDGPYGTRKLLEVHENGEYLRFAIDDGENDGGVVWVDLPEAGGLALYEALKVWSNGG